MPLPLTGMLIVEQVVVAVERGFHMKLGLDAEEADMLTQISN